MICCKLTQISKTYLVQCLLLFLYFSLRPNLENCRLNISDWFSIELCPLLEMYESGTEFKSFMVPVTNRSSSSARRSSMSVVWRRFLFIGFFSYFSVLVDLHTSWFGLRHGLILWVLPIQTVVLPILSKVLIKKAQWHNTRP